MNGVTAAPLCCGVLFRVFWSFVWFFFFYQEALEIIKGKTPGIHLGIFLLSVITITRRLLIFGMQSLLKYRNNYWTPIAFGLGCSDFSSCYFFSVVGKPVCVCICCKCAANINPTFSTNKGLKKKITNVLRRPSCWIYRLTHCSRAREDSGVYVQHSSVIAVKKFLLLKTAGLDTHRIPVLLLLD